MTLTLSLRKLLTAWLRILLLLLTAPLLIQLLLLSNQKRTKKEMPQDESPAVFFYAFCLHILAAPKKESR